MSSVVGIIVTYNRRDLLKKCVDAVLSQKEEPEVFVFDNNGTDGTETMMLEWQRQNKRIYYHRSDSNLGATGGFSRAMKLAAGKNYDFFWLMDDDTIPQEGALGALLAAYGILKGNCGFLGSRVLWTDGTVCAMNRQRRTMFTDVDDGAKEITKVVMSSFVSFFVPVPVVRKLGLPIAEFFIWSDDWEYARRISRNYPCYLVPESKVIHAMKKNTTVNIATDSTERMERYRYFYRNDVFLFRREGIKGWAYLLAKNLWHSVQVAAHGKMVFKKLQIIWGGFLNGIRFRPAIQYTAGENRK